ncbi:7077_t:CDS:2, partial [Scutellospora calospora]
MEISIYHINKFKLGHRIKTNSLSLLLAINREFFIIFTASISDWMALITPPIFMAVGAFYMRILGSDTEYNGEFLETILYAVIP